MFHSGVFDCQLVFANESWGSTLSHLRVAVGLQYESGHQDEPVCKYRMAS